MPQLAVRLLGQLEVTLDGEPVSGFASDKVRALLAYLVVEADRPHRREKLAGLLWPDRPEQLARANLRRALSNLRQVIGDRDAIPPYLRISRQTIQFNSASDTWIDVAAFAHLLEAQSSAQGVVDPLEEAATLYRGTFLEGFTLTDNSATEEWVLFHRERYLRLLVETLCRLAESYERRGEYGRGLDHTHRWVKLAPLQEKAHRQLMYLLALSGQRAAALAQYEACRRVLAEELSTEPAAETTRLYERIRDGEIERDKVPRHNLPPQLAPFVGRRALLSGIREWLEAPACRLLTLVGPGGSGKTRLALEVALQFVPDDTDHTWESERFPDGVYFMPLRSADSIGPAIARALGFPFSRVGDPRAQLLDYLRQKRMLLVLDNVEYLLQEHSPACPEQGQGDGLRMVTDILTVASDVKVLATSRAALNVQGEQLCPIGGMDFPPLPSSKGVRAPCSDSGGYARAGSEGLPTRYTRDASRYDAVRLFLIAARRARPSFDPTGDDLAQVVRICHLVDGMPLAILLAAVWIGILSPAEIADEIQQSYDFLETWLRDVPKRQRSMRTVFDHSWNLLSECQQNTLAKLSVFRGGFTREAARQVTGTSLRDLVVLVNQSFLQRTPGGQFEMHGLLRQYTTEKLTLSQADEEVRDQHCAYYAAAMQKWMEEWKGSRRQAAQVEMEADIENARTAWDWAVEQGYVERLDQAADVLASFCDLRSRYQEGEAAFRSAADMLAKAEAQSPAASVDRLRVWAKILARQGVLCWGSGRAELARQLVQRSLELLEHPALAGQDIRLEKAISLLSKGWIEFHTVGREMARASYEQSLALCREVGDRYWTARSLLGLGTVLRSAGSLQEAQRLYQEALAIHRALGLQGGIVDDLVFLGITLMVQGQYEEAERLQREAVALCQEMGDQPLLEHTRRHLAVTLMSSGKYAESHSLLEECVAFRENLGHGFLLGHANTNLARAKLHLGQYKRARERGRTGLALSREMDDLWGIGIALLVLAHVALRGGAHAEAQLVVQESVDVLRESENRDSVYQALVSLAHAELGMGHLDRARGHLYEALLPALEYGCGFALLSALPVIALLLEDEGRAERAVEVYALASRYGYVANSCWWEDVAGQHIAGVAATLPPEVVLAAQERGRVRDLEATVAELLAE